MTRRGRGRTGADVSLFRSYSSLALNDNSIVSASLADDFESKFQFHPVEDLPPPEEFKPFPRVYPSKENRGRRSALLFSQIYPWFPSHLLMFSPPQWTPNPPGRGHTSDEPRRSDGSTGPSPWTPAGSLCVCEHVCTCGVPPRADCDLWPFPVWNVLNACEEEECVHARCRDGDLPEAARSVNPAAGFSTGTFSFHSQTTTVVQRLSSSSSCNNFLQQKCSFVEPPTSSVLLQTSVSHICLYVVVLVFMLDIFRNINPQTSCRKCPFDNEQNVLVLHCI